MLNYTSSHEELKQVTSTPPRSTAGSVHASLQGFAARIRQGQPPKLAQGDEEAEVSFPSVQDAQEIHDQSVEDHGQPYAALLDPGKLESSMGRAQNHYYYGQGSPGELMADAAGALAHGMGMSQAFEDGNKRAAYHTARYFLHNNGYGHLSPVDFDDEEFADHLIGHGEGTHSLEDTQNLFKSRLRPGE